MNKKLLAIVLTGISSVALAVGISACGGNTDADGEDLHTTHLYNQQVTIKAFLLSEATCTEKAKYYFSCSCGKRGNETFEYGELAEHDYVKNVCSVCEDDRTTQGLEYKLNYNNTSYSLSGTGTVTYEEIYVAYKYEGLPVTGIEDFAFQTCDDSLRHIVIPDGVANIGDYAFHNCAGLEAVSVDENNEHFSSADGILYNEEKTGVIFVPKAIKGDVEIPEGVERIKQSKFQNRSGLTGLKIPDSVTKIEEDAFLGCDGIIQTENGVRYVDKWVIGYDDSISDVVLRDNTRGIADKAFENCDKLTSIIIPDSVKKLGDNAFASSGVKTVEIGNGVTILNDYAFHNCAKLTSITLPDSITYIGDYVLENCGSLYAVTIPDSVLDIGYAVFRNCGMLTSVVIGNGLTRIYDNEFENCVSLNNVSISDSVKSINSKAFKNCRSLKSLTIPESVKCILDYAFDGCDGIVKNVHGIQYVDKWAISCDNRLETANLRDGTIGIAYGAFNSSWLTKIIIPDTVKYVHQSSFNQEGRYAYSYQILETKQRFISQINRGDLSVRVAEDIDDATLSFAEIKAITSDNPKIKRKMEIEVRLGQLSDLEKVYRDNRYALQAQIYHAPERINAREVKIKNLQSDIQLRNEHDKDLIRIGKNSYEERKDAGALLVRVVKSGEYVGKTVGFIKGFKIVPQAKKGDTYSVKLIGAGEYDIVISDSDVGTISRLENGLDDFEFQMRRSQSEKESIEEDLTAAKEQVDKPFEQAEEAEQLRNELAAIDAELDLGKQETPIVLDEDTEAKPIVEVLNEDDDEDEAEVA